jgi:hypothetical protein
MSDTDKRISAALTEPSNSEVETLNAESRVADTNECPGPESPNGEHCEHLYSDGLCCWCDTDPYGIFSEPGEKS